jgi:hypothetical protein
VELSLLWTDVQQLIYIYIYIYRVKPYDFKPVQQVSFNFNCKCKYPRRLVLELAGWPLSRPKSLNVAMATRNRTNLYISYRQSYTHHPTFHNVPSQEEELDTLIPRGSDAAIEMDILPPAWTDTTFLVDEILQNITKWSARLDKLHAKHVLPGFSDRSEEEGEIEKLTGQITKVGSPGM